MAVTVSPADTAKGVVPVAFSQWTYRGTQKRIHWTTDATDGAILCGGRMTNIHASVTVSIPSQWYWSDECWDCHAILNGIVTHHDIRND